MKITKEHIGKFITNDNWGTTKLKVIHVSDQMFIGVDASGFESAYHNIHFSHGIDWILCKDCEHEWVKQLCWGVETHERCNKCGDERALAL